MHFLEHVVPKTGETVAIILDRYGIENSRWSEVREITTERPYISGHGFVDSRAQGRAAAGGITCIFR